MKIAQICPRYYPDLGGVETYVKEVSERLSREGFEIDVLTTDPAGKLPKSENLEGVDVKRFKSYTPSNAYTFSPQLEKYLKNHASEYDILHAHQYHAMPSYYASRAKNGNNKLVFNTYYHGKGHTFFRNLLHTPYKIIGKSILERSDKIICISEHEKKILLQNFKLDPDKILIIPCGIEINEFKYNKKGGSSNNKILTVSRIERYKGIQYLVEAMPLLDPETTLEIIGKGPYKEKLVELSKRHGLSGRVMFHQNIPREELVQRYYDSDLFALLSQYESYGIVVAEALASGTPVIVADTSALSEWVDGVNCYGIRYPVDVKELACLISRVMGKTVNKKDLPTWNMTASMFKELYISL